jgi:anti-sigma regulatory factor (Ser/Thr protein kinase)
MAISLARHGEYTVLALNDPFDGLRPSEVRRAIEETLAGRFRGVICDLGGVRPSAHGCNLVLVVADLAERWPETWMALVYSDAQMTSRLKQLKIPDRVPVYTSVEDAASNLARRALAPLDTVRLARFPGATQRARDFVGAACRRWGVGRLTADADIAVTELVNNAFQHSADSSAELSVSLSRRGLRIWVGDRSPALPPRSPVRLRRGQVTGLGAVALLSDSWGVLRTAVGGKIVWCLLGDKGGPLGSGNGRPLRPISA